MLALAYCAGLRLAEFVGLKLRDLIDMAEEKARERLREADLGVEAPPDEFQAIAHKVAVAALKFADLSNFRGTSYVYDLERFRAGLTHGGGEA